MKKILSLLLALVLAATALGLTAWAVEKKKTDNVEFKAVWVSTVYNLDYPTAATTDPVTLKKEADAILDNCEEMGMTAVILQVRPCTDAFYPSKLFPWSVYLTGDQDTAPEKSFDPLAYWIEEAHKRGIELHAWINPYRVTKNGDSDYAALSKNSPAKQHPEWVVKCNNNYYLDPGIPEVQKLITDGVNELLENYDIDGIHFDDYFYPGTTFDDADTYAKYGSGYSDIGDWRRNNVNTLIQAIHKLTQQKEGVSFGVSPFGIWANSSKMAGGSATNGNQSYFTYYADSKKWVEEGWIDYICPQIYWNIGYSAADYETLINWWANVVKNTGVKLYIGMADYKAGNSSSASPWYGIEELKRQTALNRTIPEISGEVHFRYEFLLTLDRLKEYYTELYHSEEEEETFLQSYPSKDGSGTWIQYQDKSWSFLKKKEAVTGWQKIDSVWYYFDSNGLMHTGWLFDTDGKWYYLNASGSMKTSWLLDTDGEWYFFNGSGSMRTGWVNWKNEWYYTSGSGAMKKSCWVLSDGKWYYLLENGVMARNTVINGYVINGDGVWVS